MAAKLERTQRTTLLIKDPTQKIHTQWEKQQTRNNQTMIKSHARIQRGAGGPDPSS